MVFFLFGRLFANCHCFFPSDAYVQIFRLYLHEKWIIAHHFLRFYMKI